MTEVSLFWDTNMAAVTSCEDIVTYKKCALRFNFHVESNVSLSRPGCMGLLGVIFAGFVPVASENTYPIIVFLMAN